MALSDKSLYKREIMKKIKFYLGSMWRSYRTKPLIIFLMVFVICMASVFASYLFKVIEQFNLSNTSYNVNFNENSAEYQEVISEMEKEFGNLKRLFFTVNYKTFFSQEDFGIMSAGDGYFHFNAYVLRTEDNINDENSESYGYFNAEDLKSEKNHILIGDRKFDAIKRIDRYNDIKEGDVINLNGYDYELRGIIADSGSCYVIINDENIPLTMDSITFTYEDSINMSRFVKLCKRMRVIEWESENYYGVLYGKIFSLMGLFALFSVNIIILFNHFMRKDRKLYAEYKMLGAKNYEICLAMFFATIPIVLVGSLLGLGIEALVAGSAVIGGTHMYLSALEYFIIGIINVGISLIALLFAAIRRAVKRPVDI